MAWFRIAILASVVGTAFIWILLHLPTSEAKGLLAAGAIIFILVLLHNPHYRYWKGFCGLCATWTAAHAIPSFWAGGKWEQGTFGLMLSNDVPASFDIVSGMIAVMLLLADFFQGSQASALRNIFPSLRQIGTNRSSSDSPQHSTVGDITGSHNTVSINQQHGFTAEDVSTLVSSSSAGMKADTEHRDRLRRIEHLSDTIESLVKEGRWTETPPYASQLEALLQLVVQEGAAVKHGWIQLARLEEHGLFNLKYRGRTIDSTKLRDLTRRAQDVVT